MLTPSMDPGLPSAALPTPGDTASPSRAFPRLLARLLVAGLAYYLAGRLGLLIPYVGSHVSLFWLPTGIAVAAYWRWGPSMSLAIGVAAFTVNLQIGGPAWLAAGIALGNAAGPWVAAFVLRRWGFDAALTRHRDLLVYLAAVAAGMLVTATNGTGWLRSAGVLAATDWPSAWLTWWAGDAVGALLGGVPLVAATRATLREAFAGAPGRLNAALLGVVLACGLLGFSPWAGSLAVWQYPLLSLPLCLTVVLALRAGVPAASLTVLALSATAAWGTARGAGPFSGHDAHAGLLALWSYIAALACTTVVVCALTAQLLATRRQQLALFERAGEAILVVDEAGDVTSANPAAHALFDLPPKALNATPLGALPHGSGRLLRQWLEAAGCERAPQAPACLKLARRDAVMFDAEVQAARHRDARGRLQTQIILRDVTERREAEARLAASEERYRAVLEDQNEIVCRFDAQGLVVYANEACHRLVGLSRGEFAMARWQSVVHPDDLPAVRAQLKALGPGNPVVVTEHRAMHATQGLRWMEFVNHAFYEPDGRLRDYQIVGRDVTARKELEARFAAANAELQDLYEHAPCGYHSLDAQGRYVHVNAVELAWLGCTRDEVIGKLSIFDFVAPDDQAGARARFAQMLGEGAMEGLEFNLVSRDGTVRRVRGAATSVRDAEGRFLKTRSVLHDITEIHRIRTQLQSLGHEQEAMLTTDIVGIAKTKDRCYSWVNRETERLLGYSSGELLGRSTRLVFVDDASHDAVGQAAYPVLGAGGVYRQHLQLRRKDGTLIWIDMGGAPLADGETLWVFQDITALKQQQARVEQLAFHDVLTGLPNRALLTDRLRQMLALCERMKTQLAVCFIDLDGFKEVNDTFGHDAGDLLLQQVAHRLQRCVRANDTVARLGGDEFVIVLSPLHASDECRPVLGRVLAAVSEPVDLGEGRQGRVSASIGVALYPDDGADGDALMAQADKAMYGAKRAGRNRITGLPLLPQPRHDEVASESR